MYKHAPLTSTHFAAIPAPWPAVWGNSTCTPHYTHGMNCSTPPMQRSDFKYYKHIMHWHTLLQTWGRGLTVLLIPPPYRLTHLACPHPTHLASPSHLSGLPHPAPLNSAHLAPSNPAHMLPHLRPPCSFQPRPYAPPSPPTLLAQATYLACPTLLPLTPPICSPISAHLASPHRFTLLQTSQFSLQN